LHPILIDFGRFKLYSYGLMLFIAFILGIFIASRREKRYGLPEAAALDFSVAIIISSLIGSRTLYVLTHIAEFRGRWFDVVNPFQSDGTIGIAGLVLVGGVTVAILTILAMAWLRDINLLRILDVFAPSLALGIAIGRIGCLLNGCCYGLPTELPWGITFPMNCPAGAHYVDIHIHPTQIYAILYNFAIFGIILFAEKGKIRFPGFSASIFFMVYGIFRFINESLRYHESGMHLVDWNSGFITVSQVFGIGLFLIGTIIFIVNRNASELSGNSSKKDRIES